MVSDMQGVMLNISYVLILVVMEYGLRPKELKSISVFSVLILVVMEYGLRLLYPELLPISMS